MPEAPDTSQGSTQIHSNEESQSFDEDHTSTELADSRANSGPSAQEAEDAEDAAIAQNETKAVRVLRAITLLVMATAAVAVSVSVYMYMKKDEEDSFSENFYDLAHRLVDGFHANAALRVQTMDMLGLSLTSSAIATDAIIVVAIKPAMNVRLFILEFLPLQLNVQRFSALFLRCAYPAMPMAISRVTPLKSGSTQKEPPNC